MKIKNNPKDFSFFLIFSNPLKQIKIKSFGLKTLLKACIKTLEKMKIFGS